MKAKRKMKLTDTSLLLLITVVVFFAMYIGAILFQGKGFLKPQTFFNILNANAALIIISCGMSLVMITGGIDISVGGVVALVSMCCAVYLDYHGGNIFGAIGISLLIGLGFGLVQGYLVAYLDIQPFIVSLAGMFFEIGVVVALLVVILLFCVLRFTKFGRKFYAVGGNSQSALMLGINVKRTKFFAYLICSVLAGIGGFVYFMHVGSGSASHASGMEMNAIASSIIGGTMLTGGVGNIIGTFFGVLSLSTIQNIVSSAGLDQAWWTGITIAAMLCLFLVVQSIVMSRKKKLSKG